MSYKALQIKRHFIADKTIISIDPAKQKHQVVILDSQNIQIGRVYTFKNSFDGYHLIL